MQLFSNLALSRLDASISNVDTTISLQYGGSLFPVANTGAAAIGPSADWFKIVIQDADQYEIAYVRTHTSGSLVLSNIIRGQEGTSAGSFLAGANVAIRVTATDAIESLAGSSALATTGNVTSGTWSASFGSVSGANLTSLTAANISSGNLGSGVLPYSTTSSTASAFKVPFLNSTGTASGNFGLLHDTEATFTYNPSTNTLAAGTFNGTLDWSNVANKPDPVITLNGDLSGSVTLTDLGSGTLTATIVANSVALGTDTTGAYVADVVAGTGVSLSETADNAEGNVVTVNIGQAVGTTSNVTFNSVTLGSEPTQGSHAATKTYVDSVAQGLHTHDSCNAATTGTLTSISGGTVTYNNGTGGVGATLTTTGSYTTIDGVTLTNGMRILVKNEANAAHNGIYDRTSSTVLTRSDDFDTPIEMGGGDFTFVNGGTLYDNTGWVMTDPVTTVGTTAVNWVQFSGAGTYIAGNGLTQTGSTFDVVGTSNRITVAADSVDIASTYVGQSSITTVGTISSGTWSASFGAVSGANLTSLTAANISSGNLGSGVLPYSTVSSTASAFKIPFLNTTGTASGNFGLLHDTEATLTYNPSTNTLVAGTFSGALDWANVTNKPDPVITLGGDLTGSVTLTDLGSGTLTATIAANSVALGTDTTGNYVAGATGGTGITISGTPAEGWSPTITLANTTVTPASYGSSTQIPSITVDAQGRITAASNNAITVGDGTLTLNTSGNGLSGSTTFSANQSGAGTFTVTSNATNANTASTIVFRDASGNFSAGTITAALSGNATTATTATNLANGSLGTLPYQSAANTTAMLAAGTSGYILKSNGAAAPSWTINDLSSFNESSFKKSVRVATTANITLSAPQTIDGISAIAGDRVLVKNQTTTSQNGIYIVAAGAWTRAPAADTAGEIAAAVVAVDEGTANGGRLFTNVFKKTDTLGTTGMPWYEILSSIGFDASYLTAGTVPDARISGSYTGMTNLTGTGTVDFSVFAGNAADTAALPSFTWTGDLNTGIYSPGADQIGITTAGTSRLTVGTTGIVAMSAGVASTTTGTGTLVVTGGVGVSGQVTAGTFSGNGAALTTLTAANISSGNLGSGVLPYATASATASAFKVPFLNTTGIASGNFGLLLDSVGTDLTYNPSTNTLIAGTFSGALSGNATSATNATNTATTDDVATATTVYPSWVGAVSGNNPQKVSSTKLTFVPSTGTLTATTFSGALSGNATTATTWATGRTITLTGDVTGVSGTFDGSGNLSFATTIAANSVALGTDTTGNYVATIAGTVNQVSVSGSGSETAAVTLSLPQDIHTGATPTFAGLSLTGNLTVNGTTTTVNSTTVTLDDPILTLGGDTAPTVDDNKDRGIEFRWHNGTVAKVGFFGYDDSTGKLTFIPDATNTLEVFSGTKGTIDANLEWADVLNKPDPVVTVTLTGEVTGTGNTTLTDLGNGSISFATTIAANVVGANELDVVGNGTTAQYLRSDGDGSFTWATPTDTTYSAGNGITLTTTTFSVTAGQGLTQDAGGLSLTNLTSGSTTVGALSYNGTTAAAGKLDGGTTTPTGTTRLNYGGYLYPTYINLIGSADTATAATHYFVETGSDGYVRPKTLANTQAEIVTSATVVAGLGYTPYNSTNPAGYITSASLPRIYNVVGTQVFP